MTTAIKLRRSDTAATVPTGLADGELAVNRADRDLYIGPSGGGTGIRLGRMPRGHIFGLIMSNNATDAANDIDVAAGEARSDDNTTDIILAASITKRLDAAWAVGSGNGGLDTGSETATAGYHVWLIMRVDTGVVDVLFSLSATSPTLPTNYTKKRRIGWFYNASSTIRPFLQTSNDPSLFLYTTTVLDHTTATLTTARALATLTVPPNTMALIRAIVDSTSAGNGMTVLITPTTETNAAPSITVAPLGNAGSGTNDVTRAADLEVQTDASSQIATRSNNANTILRIVTRGWRDERGRLN